MQQLTIKSFNIILLLLVLTGIAQSNEETLAFADQNTVYVSSLNDLSDDDETTTDLGFTQQHHHVVEPSTATRCDSHHVFKTHTAQTKPIRAPPLFLQS